MDYSLLIGIHDVLRGNTEGIRDNNLHIVTVCIYIKMLYTKDILTWKLLIDQYQTIRKINFYKE